MKSSSSNTGTIVVGILSFILVIGLFVGLSYGFGWIGVHQTRTIGKAQQNAQREVFEETQSYVFARRQEALKFYKEYQSADVDEKTAIEMMVSHSFADFDEAKLEGRVRDFVEKCKYN